MAEAFESAREKLARAQKHLLELQGRQSEFLARNPYCVISEDDASTGDQVIKLKFTEKVPLGCSSIVSDVANNLRDVLDHAGYAVAAASGNAGTTYAAFPFAGSAAQLDNSIKGRSKHIPEEILALFRTFKPYRGGNNLLWALNQVANANKHGMLKSMAVATGGITDMHIKSLTSGSLSFGFPPCAAKDEFILARHSKGAKFDGKLQFRTFIAFDEIEVVRGQPAVGFLDALVSEIQRILLAIEAEACRIGIVK